MIVRNAARCRQCDTVIESTYRHDFQTCKCGAIFVDGGKDYLRGGGEVWQFESLAEVTDGDMDMHPDRSTNPTVDTHHPTVDP